MKLARIERCRGGEYLEFGPAGASEVHPDFPDGVVPVHVGQIGSRGERVHHHFNEIRRACLIYDSGVVLCHPVLFCREKVERDETVVCRSRKMSPNI